MIMYLLVNDFISRLRNSFVLIATGKNLISVRKQTLFQLHLLIIIVVDDKGIASILKSTEGQHQGSTGISGLLLARTLHFPEVSFQGDYNMRSVENKGTSFIRNMVGKGCHSGLA